MERKEPCQGSSTSSASIPALGLPGCGAPARQVTGTGNCSRKRGHRQSLKKPNYTFGGSQISQHQSSAPFAPSRGVIPKGHALGCWVLRAWTMAGTGCAVSAGQTHLCRGITSRCRKATSCLFPTSVLVNSALNHWSSCGHSIPRMSK